MVSAHGRLTDGHDSTIHSQLLGLPISSLREITALNRIRHENTVMLKCVAVGRDLTSVFLVMEYCEHDLATLMDNMPAPLPESAVKCLMLQLLRGVEYLHSHYLVHRDIKLSNILLTDKGILKIADFGLARSFSNPPGSMTPRVVTLWYRAPELLLGLEEYTPAVDLWSVGCIMGELLNHAPLMPAPDEARQIELIAKTIGSPNEDIWPGYKSLPKSKLYKWPRSPYNNISTKVRKPESTSAYHVDTSFLFFQRQALNCSMRSVVLMCWPKADRFHCSFSRTILQNVLLHKLRGNIFILTNRRYPSRRTSCPRFLTIETKSTSAGS